ncbi:MAG: glycogen synthase [Chloroflexi bacterium]|nr:glycogen synthase [Chloroflexota bacterium]
MSLKILTLAAESAPLVKVGGLGDVVGALPQALKELGCDVRVALPHYHTIDAHPEKFKLKRMGKVTLKWSGQDDIPALAATTEIGGIPYYLLGNPYLHEGRVYGVSIEEDGPKYIFYSMSALALCRHLDWQPDVIHVHDSHAGAAIYWLTTKGKRDPFWKHTASVLTIHNLPYQNNHAKKFLAMAGLKPSRDPRLPRWARDGLMGLAIAYADEISAVSDGYANEIMGEEYGAGLDGVLKMRDDSLSGVLNGLDYSAWNPKTDPALKTHFDEASLEKRIENKLALQKECGLKIDKNAPLIGMVSRLDHQKGLDIAAEAMWKLLAKGSAQFVLLGTGTREIEVMFRTWAGDFPKLASINLKFDSALASRIYAGADIFLMPSRYEPCGISQMIAMRYGALPVVRATGGLVDTVQPYRNGRGTGFAFKEYSSAALLRTLKRAIEAYHEKNEWRGLQLRGMANRFTWHSAAEKYVRLYERAIVMKKG